MRRLFLLRLLLRRRFRPLLLGWLLHLNWLWLLKHQGSPRRLHHGRQEGRIGRSPWEHHGLHTRLNHSGGIGGCHHLHLHLHHVHIGSDASWIAHWHRGNHHHRPFHSPWIERHSERTSHWGCRVARYHGRTRLLLRWRP